MEAEQKWIPATMEWSKFKEALGHTPDEIECFSGTLEDVISRFQSLSVYCRSIGYKDVNLEAYIGGGDDSLFDLTLSAKRLETQEEADKRVEKNRIAREQQAAEKIKKARAREDRDRSEYERLKKKYRCEPDG